MLTNFCSADLFIVLPTNFCSAVFVLLTNFCSSDLFFVPPTNFCSAVFVPLTNFCSADVFFIPPTNFCSADLFALTLSPPIFVWVTQNNEKFLFCHFCSAAFVLLTFLHLHLGFPSPNGQESLPIFVLPDRCYPFKVQTLNEQSLWNIPFYIHLIFVLQFLFCYFCSAIFILLFLFRYFCSAVFVPLFLFRYFVPQFLFRWPFCTCTYQFLFHNFCSADLFALALGVPITQWPRVPTNFCSAIFVSQFLFCWPFCTCTYQFLFHNFCSADLFALALGVPVTQWPRVPTNFCSTW